MPAKKNEYSKVKCSVSLKNAKLRLSKVHGIKRHLSPATPEDQTQHPPDKSYCLEDLQKQDQTQHPSDKSY